MHYAMTHKPVHAVNVNKFIWGRGGGCLRAYVCICPFGVICAQPSIFQLRNGHIVCVLARTHCGPASGAPKDSQRVCLEAKAGMLPCHIPRHVACVMLWSHVIFRRQNLLLLTDICVIKTSCVLLQVQQLLLSNTDWQLS